MAYSNELIGEHESIVKLRALVEKVAKSAAKTVLIYGETGTGKGLVARMLHNHSSRKNQNFVDLNCAAIPPHLVESELFGYEKGAFTGANTKKSGLLESAHNGSLFLDEIRELDFVLQSKLLSMLDTHQYRRVGAVAPINVDVRFIAATNRILYREVQEQRFREDLYFRLQVVSLNIPPLRERGDDCFLLVERLLSVFGDMYGKTITGWEPAVEDIFRNFPWPGNVRELENLIERIFILEDEDKILVKHLPDRIIREVEKPTWTPAAKQTAQFESSAISAPMGSEDPLKLSADLQFHEATAQLHRQLINNALMANNNNVTDAARQLGITRHSLRHHMIKLGLG